MLAAGDATATALQTPAVFRAADLGISAQPIEVRMWVEDFLPERDRVYSPPHRLYVLTTDEHAIWIMDQLSRWHRSAIEVRDRELQLYEENQRLRKRRWPQARRLTPICDRICSGRPPWKRPMPDDWTNSLERASGCCVRRHAARRSASGI